MGVGSLPGGGVLVKDVERRGKRLEHVGASANRVGVGRLGGIKGGPDMLGNDPGLVGSMIEESGVYLAQSHNDCAVIRVGDCREGLPDAVAINCRILFEHVEGKDDITAGERLTIRPFDAGMEMEGQGKAIARIVVGIREPGRYLAGKGVDVEEGLIDEAL